MPPGKLSEQQLVAERASLVGSNSPTPPTDAVRAAERSSGEGAGMGRRTER